jgi:arylsulfatase A-like enzyme
VLFVRSRRDGLLPTPARTGSPVLAPVQRLGDHHRHASSRSFALLWLRQDSNPHSGRHRANGVLFENGVTQTPLTPPSHASIFTGLNPPNHKVRDTGGFILSPSTPTLASLLQEKGWDTAAFVSSAVLKKRFGFDRGFAVYDDQMPRPGNRQEFLEDAERRAGDTVDRAVAMAGRPERQALFPMGAPLRPAHSLRSAVSFPRAVQGPPLRRRDRLRRSRTGTPDGEPRAQIAAGKDNRGRALGPR